MKTKKISSLCIATLLTMSTLFSGCGNISNQEASVPPAVQDSPVGPSEELTVDKVVLPDTVRWFNASYAVLTAINGNDYNTFGGMELTDANQEMQRRSLEEWWGVTDRATADETLDWILTEGHRQNFVENMEYLDEMELGTIPAEDRAMTLLYMYENISEDEAAETAKQFSWYEEFGATAIDGWDYCRALNLLSFYYVAGYYTEEEAWDKSLEIALEMQPKFGSWDELIDSYLRGYEYWNQSDSAERRGIYEALLSAEDNPYAVDYNTTLQKEW